MKPRDRILDAAMTVFRRHGFRRSSIEQAAEAAGLTRQALYHHFKSKEALFRAVIERLHDSALAAEIAAANAAEKAGGSLADILVAGFTARMQAVHRIVRGLAAYRGAVLRTSRCRRATSTRNMPASTPPTAPRRSSGSAASSGSASRAGMTAPELARCVEMAINGAKSANPGMQPADAFVARSHHHGANAGRRRRLAAAEIPRAKPAAKKPSRKSPLAKTSGGRK